MYVPTFTCLDDIPHWFDSDMLFERFTVVTGIVVYDCNKQNLLEGKWVEKDDEFNLML